MLIKPLKCFNINKYILKLKIDKQLSYRLIYSSKSIELKTLKTYIKINLANNFIVFLKFSFEVFILFVREFNRSFYFSTNYWVLNNLTIKNQYLLLLISELFD